MSELSSMHRALLRLSLFVVLERDLIEQVASQVAIGHTLDTRVDVRKHEHPTV